MSELRERAERLRRRARPLEPDAEERRELVEATIRHTEEFLEALKTGPSWYPPRDSSELTGVPIGEEGRPFPEVLDLIRREVERQGLNPASPRDIGYVPGGGIFVSALGDYVAAINNAFSGYFPASPGAARVENRLVEWIAEIVGYPEGAGGTLTSGGSVAALTAIIAAREAKGLRSRDYARASVYVTSQEHYSVRKAVHLAGVAEAPCRIVAVDEDYRLAPESLAAHIRKDREDGLIPWLVVSTAGTTNTGAVDPLDAVSEIARAEGLWHHVDGAYGGFYVMVPSRREVMRGIEKSDSVVLDPHKSLFLPYGSGAVVVRDAAHLETFRFKAPYLVDKPQAESSPSERSIELTRHFRGLRLFLPLLLHGTDAFAAALEERWVLACYLQDELRQWEDIEVGPEPELSTMCFRYRPPGPTEEEINDLNRRLIAALHADGRIFVTATYLDGRYWLRPSPGIFRTHAEHIDEFLEILKDFLADL
jgi:glutamate/tyrosine decarboxylase-like PLP-dependent enzyme